MNVKGDKTFNVVKFTKKWSNPGLTLSTDHSLNL